MTQARSLCGILDQRTAILDNRLFWSSGNYTFSDSSSSSSSSSPSSSTTGGSWSNTTSLYWLALNATTPIDVHGPIDTSLLGTAPLPSDALTGGTSPMSGGAAGTFFHDGAHTLYAYGGMVGREADGVDNALWAFDTRSDSWRLVDVEGGRIAFGNNSEGVHATDARTGTSYRQEATGDIPDKRSEFCAGVSSAPDDSSFQITMTGGWDQFHGRAFNDVYVLSLPSFRWIRISDSNNPDTALELSPGRNRHKCDMWEDAQMIVTGGLVTLGLGTTESLNDVCNETYPPIRVLDTSTHTWRAQFEPGLQYSVPNAVTAVIGGK
ncbi:putative kelch repeat protein [Diplodia seriata]|uniref:Putative kelch repeat protein n=1 Tax=Diplodia seriata TaxID=420778 RepID=A0A0G2GPZ3_9PEZI|nr:putative kelch repeat protein [Diplodia seriata]